MRHFIIGLPIAICLGLFLPLTTNAAPSTDRSLTLVAKKPEIRKRVALVIGNGKYKYSESLPKLANPPNDAEDIAKALRGFGFDVIEKKNLTQEEMDAVIVEFGRKIVNSEAALFYFAGHGLQVKGQNYLVPVDARIESEAQISSKSININQLLEELDNGQSRANIVMLDACRNNPLSGKFRSGAMSGLAAPTSAPKGTVIVYATDPGGVAADGNGRNGLFTAGLLTAFKGNDLSLGGVLTRASEEVERSSEQKQTPYINGPATLQKNFQFAPNKAVANLAPAVTTEPPAAKIPSQEEIEQANWIRARDSGSLDEIRDYLKQYPNGKYATLAKELIKKEQDETTGEAEVRRRKEAIEANAVLSEAEAGNLKAMKSIADYYDAGIGVKKDSAKATMWRDKAELKAANAGNIEAMLSLAVRYDQGLGVKKDPAQAKVWREKVREEKHKRAINKQIRIDNFSYFQYIDFSSEKSDRNEALSLISPIFTLLDVSSLPTRTAELNKIKNEAVFRPASWGKPDSMIARALLQQKEASINYSHVVASN